MKQTKVISMIFITFHHMTSDGSRNIENGRVTHIQAVKASSAAVTVLRGRARGSWVNSMLKMVVSAMMWANGNSVAKPQPWVCGFITLIHTHISTPFTGERSTDGSRPNTIRVTRMSRTLRTP